MALDKKRRMLLLKQKRLIGTYKKLAEFKEPCMMMVRRDNKIEFTEDVRNTIYKYEHTDGTKRKIDLSKAEPYVMPYGDRSFRTYLYHEDLPIQLPGSITVMTDEFEARVEKILTDHEKSRATHGKGLMWKEILIGIAILAGVLIAGKILYGMFTDPVPVAQMAQDTGEYIWNGSAFVLR